MKLGIDILLEKKSELLEGKRVGILANSASVGASGIHAIDKLAYDTRWKVTALFGPEHGVSLSAQDMEAVDSSTDPTLKIPVHSLYGKTINSLTPTSSMLADIDILVVDLQDIGSRYYTYVWTACLCLKACASADKTIVICDRPNPLGGELVEGPVINEGFTSFVGLYPFPVRHGMTIGEIVHFVNGYEKIGAHLSIMKADGWKREMSWPDTGLKWQNPSPNMRSYEAALLYPGMCLIEGTNLSEGRGTDEPFIQIGAPYIDKAELAREFNELKLPGVHVEATTFLPSRQKWANEECFGVRWHIEDEKTFRPYFTGLAFIWLVNKLYNSKGFDWRLSPYEFVTDQPAIDLLTGSAEFRSRVHDASLEEIEKLSKPDEEFLALRLANLHY